MTTFRAPLLFAAAVLTIGLACGGASLSVDPLTHLESVCESSGVIPVTTDLVQIDLPAKPLDLASLVRMDGSTTYVDGVRLTGPLLDELQRIDGLNTAIAGLSRAAPPAVLLIEASANVPNSQIVATLKTASLTGFETVHLLVSSNEAVPTVSYPDPHYAADLKSRIDALPPEQVATTLAIEFETLLAYCPDAEAAFQAVAYASPDLRCTILAHGLAESLPYCLLTNGDQVISAAQLMLQPRSQWTPTALTLSLTPNGTPLSLQGATWEDIATELLPYDGQSVYIQ